MESRKAITVYTESTPNPASLKFVASQYLLEEGSVEYLHLADAVNAPFAASLFQFSGVKSVFITSNFVTITKDESLDWYELSPLLRTYIQQYLREGSPLFTGPKIQQADANVATTITSAIDEKIIATLDEYVKPAVEQDGGAILFKSFESGIVTVVLKGSCSGCPSSTMTLKGGIENLLKQLIPEVTEVVAEAG